jgi:hypothetical protein
MVGELWQVNSSSGCLRINCCRTYDAHCFLDSWQIGNPRSTTSPGGRHDRFLEAFGFALDAEPKRSADRV